MRLQTKDTRNPNDPKIHLERQRCALAKTILQIAGGLGDVLRHRSPEGKQGKGTDMWTSDPRSRPMHTCTIDFQQRYKVIQ